MTHYAADQRLEQRKMRATKYERIDLAAPQRLQILFCDSLERRSDIDLRCKRGVILDRALRHADALLGYLDESRRSRGKHGDSRIQVANRLRIGIRLNRGLRCNDPDSLIARCVRSRACTRFDNPDDGNGKRLLGMSQTRCSSGVACDNDELDPALHQP